MLVALALGLPLRARPPRRDPRPGRGHRAPDPAGLGHALVEGMAGADRRLLHRPRARFAVPGLPLDRVHGLRRGLRPPARPGAGPRREGLAIGALAAAGAAADSARALGRWPRTGGVPGLRLLAHEPDVRRHQGRRSPRALRAARSSSTGSPARARCASSGERASSSTGSISRSCTASWIAPGLRGSLSVEEAAAGVVLLALAMLALSIARTHARGWHWRGGELAKA